MTNKIKLIDRLKSWLVTLGIASVFGLAALGVNAANSYQKASAYEIENNGDLVFNIINDASNQDNITLFDYIFTYQSLDIFPFSFVGNFDDTDYYIDISQSTVYYDENGVWIDGNGYSLTFGFDYIFDADFDGPTTNDIVITVSNTYYGYYALYDYINNLELQHSADLTFNVNLDDDDLPSYDLQVLNAYLVNLLGRNDEIFVDLSFEISGTLYHADRFGYSDGSYYLIDDNADAIYQVNNGAYRITDVYIGTWVFNPSYTGNQQYYSLLTFYQSYNAPQSSGNFVSALTDFMSLIGGGIVQLAQNVGAGVVSFASGLFLDSGHLSILGGIIGIFAGIALAVGITSKVYAWVSTLGN